MEIDITDFAMAAEPFEFAASVAERGQDAGAQTWQNALREASETPLLTTEEQLQALRDHVQGMGFGEDVQTYDAQQCNALFIQLISGDLREAGWDDSFPDEFDWQAYQEQIEAGRVSGRFFRCDIKESEHFGRIFYYLGD